MILTLVRNETKVKTNVSNLKDSDGRHGKKHMHFFASVFTKESLDLISIFDNIYNGTHITQVLISQKKL